MRPRTPINCRFYQRSMSRFVIFWLLLRGRSDAARRPSPQSLLSPLSTPRSPAASAECVRPTPCSVFRISRIPLYVLLCIIDACTLPAPTPLPFPLCLLHSLFPRSRGQCLVSVSPASRCRWLRRIKILKCVRNCYTLRRGYIDFGQQFATQLGRHLRTPNVCVYVNILYQHQQWSRSSHFCLSACPLVRMSICPFVAMQTSLSVLGLSWWHLAVMLFIAAGCI